MKLYDSYCRAQRLKKSLSADAVHGFKLDTAQTPQVHKLAHYIPMLMIIHRHHTCLIKTCWLTTTYTNDLPFHMTASQYNTGRNRNILNNRGENNFEIY